MIKSLITTAWRNLRRNRSNSILNIFGLATGIACAGLIFLWIEDEVNFDRSFAKRETLYRVIENQTYNGQVRTFMSTPGPMAAAIKQEIPGVANACRVALADILFSLGDKSLYEKGCYADSAMPEMFGLQFLQGDPKQSFKDMYNIVITKNLCRQFFSNESNVIGKTLKIDNKQEYTVSGVINDLPQNSTLKIDWIAGFEIYARNKEWLASWKSNSINTYAELSPLADVQQADQLLRGFIEKKSGNKGTSAFLFSIKDWHLRDNFESGKQAGGRITYVRMFAIIAWIILAIACINFINLATASSEKRAKEVGIRKVLGSGKAKLIAQFICEAVIVSFIALVIGLIAIAFILPSFNILVEKHLSLGLSQPLHVAAILLLVLFCGVFAGIYPAFYMASFNPVTVLKKLRMKNGGAAFVRKGLVVMQFSISIILITATVIIYQQVQHIKSRPLGYDKDNLLTMNIRGDMAKNFQAIRQDLLNTGMVENAALNSFETISTGNNGSSAKWQGKDPSKDILVSNRSISPEFIATAGMQIVEGRDFASLSADSGNMLITEALAKLMGTGTAIGKTIDYRNRTFTVTGVVKNYVYGDLYGNSDPVMFLCLPYDAKFMYVRLKESVKTPDALAALAAVMKKDNAAYPFEYSFVNEQFNNRFKTEVLTGKLSRIFAGLAIFISCLGLFGLAAYTAERRVKEIGIRKVLGASALGITRLMSADFLSLVMMAIIIAIPAGWWATSTWLQNYPYRVSISWWVFVIAALSAMLIALLTVGYQSVKAAMANPVKSLRTE